MKKLTKEQKIEKYKARQRLVSKEVNARLVKKESRIKKKKMIEASRVVVTPKVAEASVV